MTIKVNYHQDLAKNSWYDRFSLINPADEEFTRLDGGEGRSAAFTPIQRTRCWGATAARMVCNRFRTRLRCRLLQELWYFGHAWENAGRIPGCLYFNWNVAGAWRVLFHCTRLNMQVLEYIWKKVQELLQHINPTRAKDHLRAEGCPTMLKVFTRQYRSWLHLADVKKVGSQVRSIKTFWCSPLIVWATLAE